MRIKKPVAVELFCGVGGMSLGFEQAGFRVVAAVDSNELNVEYHATNFPDCRTIKGDLTTMAGQEIRRLARIGDRKINLVFGGPPCQGFSLIGKRDVGDDRNQLIYRFIQLADELDADYFVMENVEGLNVGRAKEMLASFVRRAQARGYDVVFPVSVLDASAFGVPQRRRRIFVLGYRKGLQPPSYPKGVENKQATVQDALGDLPDIEGQECLFESDTFKGKFGTPSEYARPLRVFRDSSPTASGRADLSGCLLTRHKPETIARFAATPPGSTEKTSRFYRLAPNGLSSTLRAGTGPERGSYMAARPIHPIQHRCITVREAARLHSFPDWFQFHPTRWHGFRQVGNSVPPLLAKAVAQSLIRAIRRSVTNGSKL